ncbi:MAG TPA: class I SAM-dependent methyltransferase [Pusillimonas sp.]|uniref:class I SAM-dependent methyltransferase n=1 Tax=Pusillimonas sp. TaxID=3040095 RepID=UPI002C621B4F|nr:class I SAM-dependent methyltransferase [Pusillimonas sp.]HUH88995.1 class I SAM-dependent methyltransferase [Pusillimonas sp.]
MQDQPVFLQHADPALMRLAAFARRHDYSFTTPSPSTHARVNSRPENQWATDMRGVLGWNRPFKADAISPELYQLMQQALLPVRIKGGWKSRLRLSALDDQLYWHSGFPTSETDAVFFGPDTYRFTQSIQLYLQSRRQPIRRAFDIGCGAGAGALSIALARPEAEVWAGDINEAALRLTAVNAQMAGAGGLQLCRSNLLDGVAGEFDLVVANPPYLNDPLERTYRHGGGSHGQALAVAMLTAALSRLAPGGTLLLYTGATIVDGQDTFLKSARPILEKATADWHYRELDPDVFGEELDNPGYRDAERIAAVLLQVSKP